MAVTMGIKGWLARAEMDQTLLGWRGTHRGSYKSLKAMQNQELCPCGKPSDLKMEAHMRELIQALEYTVVVCYRGRKWEIPRHYIALHGIGGKWGKIPEICEQYGFKEITHQGN